MNKVNWEQEFSSIVEHNKQNLYEICKICIDFMEKNADSAQEGFQYFLTQVSLPHYNSDEIPDTLFDVEESGLDQATQNRIEEMEDQVVKELIFNDASEEMFYKEIWKRVSDTLLVSDSYQKSFFLLRMWLDSRIPYYQLGLGVTIDSEDYKKYVQQVNLPYRKMLFVMSAGYPKRTQKTSILLEIADEIPDRNERIVFWSLTISRLEYQISRLEARIRELEELISSADAKEE